MDYHCSRRTEIDDMKGEFTSGELISGKTIEFKIVLKVDISNWTYDPDSPTLEFQGRNPTFTCTRIAVGDDISEVVHCAFDDCDYYVPYRRRRDVIGRAWEEVWKIFEAEEGISHTSGLLKLDCTMSIRHVHVYREDYIPTNYPRMVPASDLSLGMLEEYEGEGDGDAGGCCICLEEIAGGGRCLRMPCTHVFHGDCIKEWLRTSHYCPLCRYEMPIE